MSGRIDPSFSLPNRAIQAGHDIKELKSEKASNLSSLMGTELDGHFDVFLQMFMTEIKHRDPLDEESNSSSKMLQNILMSFTAKNQVINNQNLEKINATLSADHHESAKQYIGADVRYEADMLQHAHGDAHTVFVKVPKGVEDAKILVIDPNHKDKPTLHTFDLKPQEGQLTLEGNHTLKWDGKGSDGKDAMDGAYQIIAVASGKNKTPVDIKVSLQGVVQAVEPFEEDGEKKILFVMGDFGITQDQIKRVQKNRPPEGGDRFERAITPYQIQPLQNYTFNQKL